jgi:hypothetical protein
VNNPLALKPTTCGICSLARKIKKIVIAMWWELVEGRLSERYRKWGLPYEVKPLRELDLPRLALHHLLAIHTGYSDFN